MSAPTPYADSARALLDAGWSPLPLPRRKKSPPPSGFTGYGGARPTARQVSTWAEARPTGNVAVRLPEDVLGLDVDAYDGKAGAETLRDAEALLGDLPLTWRVTSRGDAASGIRLYRVPARRQWADVLGPNVEVIHHGHRYVVGPGSIHPDTGDEYAVLGTDGLPEVGMPRISELPSLPEAWVAHLDRGAVGDRPAEADLADGEVAAWLDERPSGAPCPAMRRRLDSLRDALAVGATRHDVGRNGVMALVRLGEQGHRGLAEALEQAEADWLASLDRTPDKGEWRRMVVGAVRDVLGSPTLDEDKGCCSGSTPEEDFRVPLDELFDATPTLSHIRQAAHARLVSAPALLCFVLARVIVDTPAAVVLPATIGGRASLNLGVAVVGDSGSGKSALLAVSRELLGDSGFHQKRLERSPGSGEGLVQQFLQWDKDAKALVLADDPRRLLTVDEIDALGAVTHRNGSTISSTLRSALTGGPLGQANASRERDRHVEAGTYRLALLAGVQPTRSDTLLNDTDAGTPQRFLWVFASDQTIPDEDVPDPGPLDWLGPDLPVTADGLCEIDYPDHVKAEVRAARRAQMQGDGDPTAGHRYLTRLKVAAALALLHGDSVITDQWWHLGGLLVDASTGVQEYCRSVLAERSEEQVRYRGRMDGIRMEAASAYRDERTTKLAKSLARTVVRHAERDADGSAQKHSRDEGCTRRCLTHAARNFRPAPSPEQLDAATSVAAEQDWITAKEEGRWVPGDSRPA